MSANPERLFVRPEIVLAQTLEEVDSYFTSLGEPRKPGQRGGRCVEVARQVSLSGARNGVDLYMADLPRIHRIFGGGYEGISHYFNISADFRYLIDLSFCQFVDSLTGEIKQFRPGSGETVNDYPVLERVLRDGFVPLTDETLRGYLQATSSAQDRSCVRTAEVKKLVGRHLQ